MGYKNFCKKMQTMLTCVPYEKLDRFLTIRLCLSGNLRRNIGKWRAGLNQPKKRKTLVFIFG
jgi:hypothetical protein